MDIHFVYEKKRMEFGKQCKFVDKGPDLIDNYPSNKEYSHEYILRDPVSQGTQCSAIQAVHSVNTDKIATVNVGINHTEGGWPREVNIHDEEQTKRYRRKVEKDEHFHMAVMQLSKTMEESILQNNAINIYQQYFSDIEKTPLVEKSSARTLNVFMDQNSVTKPVNYISWSPDGGSKLVSAHCNLVFQAHQDDPTHSYIWEVENPNRPLLVLKPKEPSVCIEYHQKDPNSLVSGQFSGQVAVWDIRRGSTPVEQSLIENSHLDPVRNVLWINSKSGTEFFSSSSDGVVKWWDTRKISAATETLVLNPNGEALNGAIGASCLEYESTIPTRFMIGLENGVVLSCNRKGKSQSEKMGMKYKAHLGPVLALNRNAAIVKTFLSIGDWTAKIWSEDCRESPIIWTNYHKPRLTDGCWSPTRYSVFFTTRFDGTLDVWDILQQQNHASLAVKVCDAPLHSIRAHEYGRLVAVGNSKGSTFLVQISQNLSETSKSDKMLLAAMFERESKREKIIEARKREIRLKLKAKSTQHLTDSELEITVDQEENKPSVRIRDDPKVIAAEKEFFAIINAELKKESASNKPEEAPPTKEET